MTRVFNIINALIMNKFGRSLPTSSRQKGIRVLPISNTFLVTTDGDYNIEGHRLCNVKAPVDKGDAVNKEFVEGILAQYNKELDARITKTFETIDSRLKAGLKSAEDHVQVVEARILKPTEVRHLIQLSVNPMSNNLNKITKDVEDLKKKSI